MKYRPLSFLFAMLALVVVAGTWLSAQESVKLEPLTERVEVSVTNVDVTVTDRSGKTVPGLTREDFELLEDGKPQEITNFYAIQDASVKIPGAAAELGVADPGQFRRKVLLLADNNFIGKIQRDRAVDMVERYIDDRFAGNYEWSVVSVGQTVQTLQPFTAEKSLLHVALDRLRASPTFESNIRLDRSMLSDPARTDAEFMTDEQFGGSMRFQGREQTMRNVQATLNTARAVVQTCRAYSSSPGKKVLLLVTGGMEANTTFGAYDSDRDGNLREMKREVAEILQTMVKEANAANFTIYVVNAKGRTSAAQQHDIINKASGSKGTIQSASESQAFSKSIDTSDVDSSSLTLALGTGGRYLAGNDVGESLAAVDQESGNYYSLGYRPQHSGDGKYHKIVVRCKRPGTTARHREGYVDLSQEERFEQTLRSSFMFPKEKGTLPVTMKLGLPDGTEKGSRKVPVTAEMPMDKVTTFPRDGKWIGRVHIYLSVYDRAGDNVGYRHEVQDVTYTEAQQAAAEKGSFRYTMKVDLDRGDYTVLVTLRDDVTNEVGSAFQDLRI